jgi:hypothetical protein
VPVYLFRIHPTFLSRSTNRTSEVQFPFAFRVHTTRQRLLSSIYCRPPRSAVQHLLKRQCLLRFSLSYPTISLRSHPRRSAVHSLILHPNTEQRSDKALRLSTFKPPSQAQGQSHSRPTSLKSLGLAHQRSPSLKFREMLTVVRSSPLHTYQKAIQLERSPRSSTPPMLKQTNLLRQFCWTYYDRL